MRVLSKRSHWRRLLTAVLALAVLVSNAVVARTAEEPASSGKHVLEAGALEAFAAGEKMDGDTTPAADYFTIIWSAKSKVDSSSKTWEDGYASGQRINFGGKAATNKNAVKFTTSGKATVKIWWAQGGDDNREMAILNGAGEVAAKTSGTYTKNSAYLSTLELAEAGTYYLGGETNNNYIFKVEVEEVPAEVTNVLEADALEAFAAGEKKDGDTTPVGDYFTIIWSAKSKVDSSSKTWEDGYASGQRINFGGKAATNKNAVKFTTSGKATVKIWWAQGGDDNREMAILNGAGEVAAKTSGTYTKNSAYLSTLELAEAGTYYLGGETNNNYIFKVQVTEGGGEREPRAPWDDVTAPAIKSVGLNAGNKGQIDVTVTGQVGYDGADKVSVTMSDAAGQAVETRNSLAEKEEHVLSFTPAASGVYTFSVSAARDGEETEHAGAETREFEFTLPLAAPVMKSAANMGGGSVVVEWNPVKEATGYVAKTGDKTLTVTDCQAVFTGLTVGETATFSVSALRGEETGPAAEISCLVKNEKENVWAFSAFGTSTNTKDNGYEGNANDGTVRVYSKNGKGKIVANSYDGIAFYYTTIDPKTQNFVLSATATVNTWTYSNGQEAFGLMAADRVGVHGSTEVCWNNAYMSMITRLEYNWENGELVDSGGDRIKMYQGVGAMAKTGITPENLNESMPAGFKSVTTTLETSQAAKGPGQYNLVGKATNEVKGTVENPLTQFKLKLVKNNTGYFMYYIDPEGAEHVVKTYEPDALSQVDENVYVGFFAARNFDVTFSDIVFEIRDPQDDPAPEERPMTKVTPSYAFVDDGVSNTDTAEIVYSGSVDGTIVVTDAAGRQIYSGRVTANRKCPVAVKLEEGENKFTAVVTPDPDFKPSEYEILKSYEPWVSEHTVIYRADEREIVYVSPTGTAGGKGTKEDPTTLQEAVKWAAPGEKIYLMAGTYELTSGITLTRGINGTPGHPIYLMADPEAETRPVLDFMGQGGGLTIVAHYWYLKGFDVTRSTGNGVHVSGNHNTVERVVVFRNGNTGLQISRQKGSDTTIADWPSYNLILNCSAYLNADLPGYEDADGFAAKLTVGVGNVFDGCIAAYNADDGWDLYAKVETGSIGTVTIKNSVAFKNGWDLDENGNEINAGNGNGFKLGGENHPDGHTIINSIAFANKANGITSNSCPNNVVKDCISFDNGAANLSLYTNKPLLDTGYSVTGFISYKAGSADSIKGQGSQSESAYVKSSNYYSNGAVSVNNAGVEVQADWFVSLDTAAAIKEGGIKRAEDGSIDLGDYLKLTDKAPTDAGAHFPPLPEPAPDPVPSPAPSTNRVETPRASEFANGSVSVSPAGAAAGARVSVTVKPNAGYSVGQVVVTDASGREIAVTDNGNGVYSFLMPASAVSVSVRYVFICVGGDACAHSAMLDMPADRWYHEAVDYAMRHGIMRGVSAKEFAPDAGATRAMVITMLARLAGVDTHAGETWYASGLAWAVGQGISDGSDAEEFVSRQQAVAMLYRYAEKAGYDVSGAADLSAYIDGGQVASWAADGMRWAVSAGIIQGVGGRRLAPEEPATRAEIAAMFMNFCTKWC